MAESQYVTDVNEQTFETVVGMAPPGTVVMLDFWAPWCQPCKALTPVLERIVESYAGRVLLAKVNVDENQRLAAGFQIQGIPNVKIIKDKQMVDEFSGAIPEEQIRAMLDRLVTNGAPQEEEAEPDMNDPLTVAQMLLDQGKAPEAKTAFEALVGDEETRAAAHLGLAKTAIAMGDFATARTHATALEHSDEQYDEAQAILGRMEFEERAAASPGPEALQQTITSDPDNMDALFDYACCLVVQGQYEPALETLLTIMKKKYNYKEGRAKDAMLKIFYILGARDPLSDHYRSQMQIYL